MKNLEDIKTIDELVVVRCIIKKDCGNYFKGEDYNGKTHIIMKTDATKSFKKGTDDTFYAMKDEMGLIFKKQVLYPITSKQFEEVYSKFNKNGVSKFSIS